MMTFSRGAEFGEAGDGQDYKYFGICPTKTLGVYMALRFKFDNTKKEIVKIDQNT